MLEASQRKTLAKIAREEGRSISDVARELLRRGMEARAEDPAIVWRERNKVLAEAERHRQQMLDRRGGQPLELDFDTLIADIREERANELFARLFPDRD
jgi:hypothetical protein